MSDLFDTLGSISGAFSKYVVTPINAFGLGGFVFDVDGDTTVNLQAEITDHYTEDNVAVQDHIAIKPKKLILRNYVGELVYRRDKNTNTKIQKLAQKLNVLNNFLPTLTSAATQAKSIFDTATGKTPFSLESDFSSTVNAAANLWGLVKNLTPTTNRQQQAYMYFKAMYEQKMLVSVQTPYEFMSSMAIESVVANQSEETIHVSSFSITLKQIRKVSTQDVRVDPADYQGRSGLQIQSPVQNGNMTGIAPSSLPLPLPPALPTQNALPPYADVTDLINDPAFQADVRRMQ